MAPVGSYDIIDDKLSDCGCVVKTKGEEFFLHFSVQNGTLVVECSDRWSNMMAVESNRKASKKRIEFSKELKALLTKEKLIAAPIIYSTLYKLCYYYFDPDFLSSLFRQLKPCFIDLILKYHHRIVHEQFRQ